MLVEAAMSHNLRGTMICMKLRIDGYCTQKLCTNTVCKEYIKKKDLFIKCLK